MTPQEWNQMQRRVRRILFLRYLKMVVCPVPLADTGLPGMVAILLCSASTVAALTCTFLWFPDSSWILSAVIAVSSGLLTIEVFFHRMTLIQLEVCRKASEERAAEAWRMIKVLTDQDRP